MRVSIIESVCFRVRPCLYKTYLADHAVTATDNDSVTVRYVLADRERVLLIYRACIMDHRLCTHIYIYILQ